jgi:hypothetical protein
MTTYVRYNRTEKNAVFQLGLNSRTRLNQSKAFVSTIETKYDKCPTLELCLRVRSFSCHSVCVRVSACR